MLSSFVFMMQNMLSRDYPVMQAGFGHNCPRFKRRCIHSACVDLVCGVHTFMGSHTGCYV